MHDPLFFFGDIHGDFGKAIAAIRQHRPRASLFVGDFDCRRPLAELLRPIMNETDAWFIHGNHDTDRSDYWAHLEAEGMAGRNLHGRVVEIGGLRIAGLGGVFRQPIWYPDPGAGACQNPVYENYEAYRLALDQERRFSPHKDAASREQQQLLTHRSTIFWEDYARLWDQKADILITHEAPSCHPHGFTAIDELAQSMGVRQLFHGHHHDCLDYAADFSRLGFAAYGIGLRGIRDGSGKIIVPGERDAERSERFQQM